MIRNCIPVVASTLVSLGIIELSLRAQEELGPIIHLSDFARSLDLYSPRVHHRSAKEKTTKTAGPADRSSGAVLFLGDPWIEDGGVIEGFAYYIDSDQQDRTLLRTDQWRGPLVFSIADFSTQDHLDVKKARGIRRVLLS
jgi:hypothetical protein